MMKFEQDFLLPNLMGPSCVQIAHELTECVQLVQGLRILDLGCGTGLTSMIFAGHYRAQVFAADLWINPTDNYRRFKQFGMDKQIYPVYAEANALPFAEGYFDAVFSIDSYHYYGCAPDYLSKLAPLVKRGGTIAIVVPGVKDERTNEDVPAGLKPFWEQDGESINFHSIDWWRNLWEESGLVEIKQIFEMKCHDEAWAEWLKCDHPYAKGDIAFIEADGGRYINTIAIIATVK